MPPSTSTTAVGLRLLRRPLQFSSPLPRPLLSSQCRCSPLGPAIRPSAVLRLARTYASKPAPPRRPNASAHHWSVETNLARAGNETVLYQSGARLLVYAYYTISVASVTWAGLEFYENVICQPEAPAWTRAISSLGAGMGLLIFGYTFWVPSRIVHRIVAVPHGKGSIALQIQARSIVPFRRRIINSAPKTAHLVTPFFRPVKGPEAWKFSGYFGPLKYIAWIAVSALRRLVRALRMEDYAKLKIGDSGVVYRIDREGWTWERERKGLDMLLRRETKYYPIDGGRM